MASTYIDIRPEVTRQAAEVRAAIDQMQALLGKFSEIKSWFDQAAFGADYTALAALLGITAAEAEAVYNLWGSANGELQAATFIAQLLSRCS
jgi:hypothetical protein